MTTRASGRASRRRRAALWPGVVVVVSGSALACSLVLQDQSLPCTTDADCARYSGSRCDPAGKTCVAGAPSEAAPAFDAPAAETGDGPASDEAAPGDGAIEGARASDAASEADADATAAADSSTVGEASPGDSAALDVATAPDGSLGDAQEGGGPTIDWAALTTYLDNLYSPTERLVQQAPASGTYFTAPDNALAQRAFLYLPTPDATRSSAILARLTSYKVCGCSEQPGHDGTINHQFDPLVRQGATISFDPAGPCQGVPTDTGSAAGSCSAAADGAGAPVCPPAGIYHNDRPSTQWSADACNAAIPGFALTNWNQAGTGNGYADLIALEILNYRNQKLSTDSLWTSLAAKWDGTGMNDASTVPEGAYDVYKLALFKVAARALGKTLPVGVDATLIAAQGPNGGIRASYDSSGAFVDQEGNATTTALTVLAFLLPASDM